MDFPCSKSRRENCINAFGAHRDGGKRERAEFCVFFAVFASSCYSSVYGDAHLQGNDDAKFIGSQNSNGKRKRHTEREKVQIHAVSARRGDAVEYSSMFFARNDDEASEGGR